MLNLVNNVLSNQDLEKMLDCFHPIVEMETDFSNKTFKGIVDDKAYYHKIYEDSIKSILQNIEVSSFNNSQIKRYLLEMFNNFGTEEFSKSARYLMNFFNDKNVYKDNNLINTIKSELESFIQMNEVIRVDKSLCSLDEDLINKMLSCAYSLNSDSSSVDKYQKDKLEFVLRGNCDYCSEEEMFNSLDKIHLQEIVRNNYIYGLSKNDMKDLLTCTMVKDEDARDRLFMLLSKYVEYKMNLGVISDNVLDDCVLTDIRVYDEEWNKLKARHQND